MSEDVIGKADALMRRHRVFVAGGARPGDDDVPTLTDVVDDQFPDSASPEDQGVPFDLPSRLNELLNEIRPLQAQALSRVLDAWAAQRLPGVVAEVLEGLSDRIAQRILAETREELMDALRTALEQEPPPVT